MNFKKSNIKNLTSIRSALYKNNKKKSIIKTKTKNDIKDDSLFNSIKKSFSIYSRNKAKTQKKINISNSLYNEKMITKLKKNIFNEEENTISLYKPFYKSKMIMSQNYKNNIPKKKIFNRKKLKTCKNNLTLIKKINSTNNENNDNIRTRKKFLTTIPTKINDQNNVFNDSLEIKVEKIIDKEKVNIENLKREIFYARPLILKYPIKPISVSDNKKLKKKIILPIKNSFGSLLSEAHDKSNFLKESVDFIYRRILMKKLLEINRNNKLRKKIKEEKDKEKKQLPSDKYYILKEKKKEQPTIIKKISDYN